MYSGGPERVEADGWLSLGVIVRERGTNRQWVATYEGVLEQFTVDLVNPKLRRGELRVTPDQADV